MTVLWTFNYTIFWILGFLASFVSVSRRRRVNESWGKSCVLGKAMSLPSPRWWRAVGGRAPWTTRPLGFRQTTSKNVKITVKNEKNLSTRYTRFVDGWKMIENQIVCVDTAHSSVKSSPEKSQESPVKDLRLNRDIVLKDLVDSEKANVAELQGLANNFLQPLESTNMWV